VQLANGSIEVICGSMFSGKTDELIRRLVRARIAKQNVQVFKPAVDVRYAMEKVTSHAGSNFDAIPVAKAGEILSKIKPETTVVGIDEAQFFDDEILNLVKELARRGLKVFVAGLDTDFRGEPFGAMPALMAEAEEVEKLHAICMVAVKRRTQGWWTAKLARFNDPIVIVGAAELMKPAAVRTTKYPGEW
jgi:thymidine kinase